MLQVSHKYQTFPGRKLEETSPFPLPKNVGRIGGNKGEKMSVKIQAILISVMLGIGLYGCGPRYEGDGRFIDRGIGTASERYVVELGPLDLTKTGTSHYHMAGLPSIREMTIGLRLVAPDGISFNGLDAIVNMTLKQVGSEAVFIADKGPLNEWAWAMSGADTGARIIHEAFIYGKTEFQPYSHTRYELVVEVIRPDPKASKIDIHLQVIGGGWKSGS